MSSQIAWNRRTFVSALGLTVAAAAAPSVAEGQRPLTSESSGFCPPFFALAGLSAPGGRGMDRVQSYWVEAGSWVAVGSPMQCESLRSLALHPKLAVCYAVHGTALHEGLPRGSISAIGFDPASGSLRLISRQGLSLSATHPEHLAVSPDGRRLLVSASGGGAYNFFSLAGDGAILATPYALKQTGRGPHPLQSAARPSAAVFHKDGLAAYASDMGADRVNHVVFDGDLPSVRSRVSLPPGSGPGYMVRHPSDELLVVANRLRPSLTVIPSDADSGALLSPVEHLAVDAELGGPVAMSRSGDRVYMASIRRSGQSMVSVFRLSRTAGRLRLLQENLIPTLLNAEQLLRVGNQLLLAGAGGVVSLPLDELGGLVGHPVVALKESGAVSVAVQMIDG
jgi:6-phosphogluconolactonase